MVARNGLTNKGEVDWSTTMLPTTEMDSLADVPNKTPKPHPSFYTTYGNTPT